MKNDFKNVFWGRKRNPNHKITIIITQIFFHADLTADKFHVLF